MKKQLKRSSTITLSMASAVLLGLSAFVGMASAASLNASISATANTSSATSTSNLTATQQQHLQNIIAKGNQEIERRLNTLATLTSKINDATKLTASDKATLSDEVSSSISGLTALKSQLDSETTISAAEADVSNIFLEYRVYALLVPKVELIKVADDQQVVEGNLQSLAQKLQARITADKNAGKDVSSLQTELNDMLAQISAALQISSSIESSVINLQPSDYNSNHEVLEGDNTQLKTAHSDNQSAYNDAKNIIASLKSL